MSSTIADEAKKRRPRVTTETTGGMGRLEIEADEPISIEDALQFAKFDSRRWVVKKVTTGGHQVPMRIRQGQSDDEAKRWLPDLPIKVWCTKWTVVVEAKAPAAVGLEAAIDDLKKWRPRQPRVRRVKTGGLCVALGLHDAHFGMLAWANESGEDYDLNIAERLYEAALLDLLGKLRGYDISQFLLPIGSDLFHINDSSNETPRSGHRLDVDGRLPKVITTAQRALVRMVDACLAIAPTKLVYVPGNHDADTGYWMTRLLEAWYRNCDRVEVDASPLDYKAVEYGQSMIGLAHEPRKGRRAVGKSGLPLVFAGEFPELWGRAQTREILTGHWHREMEMQAIMTDQWGPVTVRVCPSLCARGKWAYSSGYQAVRAMQVYLYEPGGYLGQLRSQTASQLLEPEKK